MVKVFAFYCTRSGVTRGETVVYKAPNTGAVFVLKNAVSAVFCPAEIFSM